SQAPRYYGCSAAALKLLEYFPEHTALQHRGTMQAVPPDFYVVPRHCFYGTGALSPGEFRQNVQCRGAVQLLPRHWHVFWHFLARFNLAAKEK
ncbi:hypothetical protein TorRG33x02_244920, partial [Trema orientale]